MEHQNIGPCLGQIAKIGQEIEQKRNLGSVDEVRILEFKLKILTEEMQFISGGKLP